jgi:hypothetical protein
VTPAAPFEFAARVPPAAPVTPAAPFEFAPRVPPAAPVTPPAPFEFAARVAPAAVTPAAPFEFAPRVPRAVPATPPAAFEFGARAASAASVAPAPSVHATAPAAANWPSASHAATPPAPMKDPVTWAAPLDIESIRPQETSEEEEETPRRKPWQLVAAAVVLVALAGAGVTAARRFAAPSAAATDGTLIVTTNPPGARLFVDGVEQGATPFTVTLKAGAHALELRGAGAPRHVPITMTAGAQMSQYIDLPTTVAAAGQLQVKTEPAGARVSIDGVARGTTPVTVSDLPPGEHAVLLESSFGPVKQTVTIEAGITASLTVPLVPTEAAPTSGWIAISAPSEVEVFENGRLLGTSQSDRLVVSAGRHDFAIVNETLGYRATRTVQVAAGKVSPLRIEFPKGSIAVNAIPWAEVWVDGEKIGDTPIGNLQLTVGPHEFVFRNPELGEQRHAATITLTAPARLSVDLRKK